MVSRSLFITLVLVAKGSKLGSSNLSKKSKLYPDFGAAGSSEITENNINLISGHYFSNIEAFTGQFH